ncbi:NB-ARC domain-containing protein [Streptomyces actinomycinicus]|uniref:NB-ARC domain-containing protein n=1 Tax=Streptomyces actinomycinicus TaxID=1695166 RepID=UPI0027D9EC48|nr:NB-ARC domain-containing protein [Streptomyces actinomycinicus]
MHRSGSRAGRSSWTCAATTTPRPPPTRRCWHCWTRSACTDRTCRPRRRGSTTSYRDRLAGRPRTLLILDHVSDPAQFRELLPGTGRHRVLITSRDRQDTLPIRHVELETLDPDDSVALLTRALHDADERDDRAAREPDALLRLASLCGHLPLALQIAAAMLRRRRCRDITSLVSETEEAGDPTRVLDRGSPGADLYGRSLVLRPVLETSYRRLAPAQARLLRLLALAPGEDSGTEALSARGGQ